MNKRIKTLLVAFLFTSLVTAQSWARDHNDNQSQTSASRFRERATVTAQAKQPFVPGRVLVKYRSGVSTLHAHKLLMSAGAHHNREVARLGVHVFDLPADANEEEMLKTLRGQPDVEFAELDYILYPDIMTPDDPLYSSQWHLPKVSCPEAWATTLGSEQITIAICDTGIDANHPDLESKLVPGWNVVDNNSNTSPVSAHGTWTAGTAAATGNNAIGVASPALNCRIMPIRVSSLSNGAALISDMAEAVVWAADHGARVASLSYMAGASSMIHEAGGYIQSKNGLLVCSSGNTGTFNPVLDSPNIIVVGATNQNDEVASFSTTGTYVDLSAPGVGIMTTAPGGAYQLVSGTSFSTPLVAGAVALMLSVKPDLAPAQIDNILKVTSDDVNHDGWDPGYGWGRLNVERAVGVVQSLLDGSADTAPPAVKFIQPQRGGDLSGIVGISTGEMIQAQVIDDAKVAEVTLIADGVGVGVDDASPYVFSWDTSSFADGSEHTLTIVARDFDGNTAIVSTIARMRLGFDATPPVAEITSLKDGECVSGNTRISVSATDNLNVARVELFIDNQLVAQSDTPSFTMKWLANRASRGPHTLQAIAYDQAGNIGISSVITVFTR